MWRLMVHLGLPLSKDSYPYLFICLLFIKIGSFTGTPSLLIRWGCLASEPQAFTNLSLPSTGIIATMPDSLYRGWGLNSGLGACMTNTLLINRAIIASPVSQPSSRSASCVWLLPPLAVLLFFQCVFLGSLSRFCIAAPFSLWAIFVYCSHMLRMPTFVPSTHIYLSSREFLSISIWLGNQNTYTKYMQTMYPLPHLLMLTLSSFAL